MQQQPEKKLHCLRTNLLGRTLPLCQTLTNLTEGSDWTKPECFPDFFLIGAPRCGTTSLSRYLADNPQVCFSRPKEPHYFSLLSPHASLDDLETAYLSQYFSHCGGGYKAIGEGSTSYLYAPYTLQRISSVNPRAKFIAILRNPLDMLPSYHLRLRFTIMEDVEDFATAWRLQGVRARGERIPKYCLDPLLLLYREVAKFGEHVERLYHLAGRDRSLVLLFDASSATQARCTNRCWHSLGSMTTGGRDSSGNCRASSTAIGGCSSYCTPRWGGRGLSSIHCFDG
jgi:Sulfotransferase domain